MLEAKERPHPKDPRSSVPLAPLGVRIATLITLLLPLGGVVIATVLTWGSGFGWTDLGLLTGMYVLTGLGITVGFHRLFVHRSFETYTWVKVLWAVLGSMAVQGPLLRWVAMHRRHHQFSDTSNDPHSPRCEIHGILGLLRGLWRSHIGWFFEADPPDLARYVTDLSAHRSMRIASSLFPLWAALGILIPGMLGGALLGTWTGVWTGVIWGGLVRIFLVHHVTWSVNSICHLWGSRPYKSDDDSRDNVVVGILALGEGWHNSHHAFPTSARHGLKWWQFDLSYYTIRALAMLGLAWQVKLPSREAIENKRRALQASS